MMNVISTLLIVVLIVVLAKRWIRYYHRRGLPLPPGPRKLPLIGNLLSAPTQYQWVKYAQWSKELDTDIIHLQVFGTSIIVLNSFESAQEILNRRSALSSGRSVSTMLNKLMGWDWNLGLVNYGAFWRDRRRLFWQDFNPANSDAHRPIQAKYCRQFLRKVLDDPAHFDHHCRYTPASSIIEVTYGIAVQPQDDPMIAIADTALNHLNDAGIPGTFLVDYVPLLQYLPSWFPGTQFKKFARTAYAATRDMIDIPYAQVRDQFLKGEAPPCTLSRAFARDEKSLADPDLETVVKDVASVAYVGGVDTTYPPLLTFAAAMTLFPHVQNRAQAEIDQVLGGRLPSFEDREALPYSEAIMWEVFRWKTVLPLGIAHRIMSDDIYSGYFLPSGSLVFANVWSIMRDETLFPQPDEFKPERFINKDGKINRKLTEVVEITFGFGRRYGINLFFCFDASSYHPVLSRNDSPITLAALKNMSWTVLRKRHRVALDCIDVNFPDVHHALVDPTLAQERIDQQIADYQEAIHKLKTARNTHSRISQLPLEVLALIFQYTQQPIHLRRRKVHGWVTVLLVCRAWYQLALDTPRLWSQITLSEKSNEALLITRSKSTLLQVAVNIIGVEAGVIETLAAIVKSETYRVRHLKVESENDAEILAFLEASSCTSAPNLQRLDLCNDFCVDSQNQESMHQLTWDLPSLCHLTIVRLPPPSPFPIFRNLTELIIQTPQGSNDRLGVASVIQMLSQLPLLEHVELGQLSALDDNMVAHRTRVLPPESPIRVMLSRLKLLNITSHDIRQLRILRCLDFPPTARLLLQCRYAPPDLIDASPVTMAWTAVVAELARIEPSYRPTHSTIANFSGSFSIRLWASSRPENAPALLICHPPPITPFLEAIQLFAPIVTKLTLSFLDYIAAEQVSPLLNIFNGVETILVESCDPRILEVLLPPDVPQTPDNIPISEDLGLPQLKRVFFFEYYLFSDLLNPGEKHENILRLIRSRKLECVGFINCHTSAEVTERLSDKTTSLSPVLWDMWARLNFREACSWYVPSSDSLGVLRS
ncbi:hypothetical protein ONZ45_g9134 [Pleurotus djamor]|nr:hypothetical protein ONZ45_g9134 [Pleurotus djamor]